MNNRIFSFLIAVSALGASLPLVGHAQSPADARALVARYAEAKNAHDVSRVAEIFSESYVEHSGRNPSGMAALVQNWKGQFAAIPDVRIQIDDVIASGDKVVARTTYSGTHTTPFFAAIPATGRSFTFGTIDIWRVENGKFVEHWDQVDFAGLQRQLASKPVSP